MATPRRDARYARRKHLLVERLAKSSRPTERIAAAMDYLRAMLRDAPPDRAQSTAEAVVQMLITHADQLAEGSTSS
jgi:hypothetical protein